MKTGRNLEDLYKEVKRQQDVKRDFVADQRGLSLTVAVKDKTPLIQMLVGTGAKALTFGVNDVAHEQLGGHLEIPRAYYERCRVDAPELLVENVNAWMHRPPAKGTHPSKRMVRTLDGVARAVMSDKYRPLDNFDLLEAAVPPLMKMKVEIMSCEATDRRLYLKIVDARIKKDLKPGVVLGKGHDRFRTVSPALVLSNSEVGCGALTCQTSVWEGGCSNLTVIEERSTRKYHIGSRHDIGDAVYAMLSDRTRALTDAALWATIADVVKGAFDKAQFDALCTTLQEACLDEITGDVPEVVELTAKKLKLTDGEKSSVLNNLIKSGDLSRYGLSAAVTRTAQDKVLSYDRASELERLGGKIIELPKREFETLAMAKAA